ncbi:hypothetical protein AB0B12_29375 [Streptomyces sp. NPDC044780]|uniref:Integral membrane protein n=1 Tax=Streptomyces luomodiensis TaxID=3026192 RepID=A0ABY9UVN5_9ACTN|nr:hypothetical protein [Streptomyces sp. SCA4-21]WNE96612.1 hypothetical protein PS467_15390 [Streptomyces sp. SCA4-21]
MIEWRRLSTGVRPVPDPVATPVIWGGAFLGALVLVATVNFFGGHGRPMFALVTLSLLAALLGLCSRFVAAPGTAALCWLFLNGFAIPPAGQLTWAGDRDTGWLACLLAAAVAGTALARVVNARAGYRRITPPGP